MDADTDDTTPLPPNHHAHHAGFSGPAGLLAALSMAFGRGAAAALACEQVGLHSGDHLVDVGCGPGAAARVAAGRGAQVVGVDPAPVMLQVARLLSVGRRGVDWREGGAERLPVPDADATVLWALATVHHWPDVEGGLQEARRVLRPGGRLLAMERHSRPGATGLAGHGWTDSQVDAFAALVADAGFTGIEVRSARAGREPVLVVRAVAPAPSRGPA